MQGLRRWIPRLITASLLVGAVGCESSGDTAAKAGDPANVDDLKGSVGSALLQAKDCPDLLTKIKQDAVMKARLAALNYKVQFALYPERGGNVSGNSSGGVAVDGPAAGGGSGGSNSGGAPPPSDGAGGAPVPSPGPVTGTGGSGGENAGSGGAPTVASGTNTQVEGVDEADFVKLVKGGERMFLLHGSKLFAFKSWPAAETALQGEPLVIEGSPSEMFVTDDGKKAVIFSSVYDYNNGIRGGAYPADAYCSYGYCGGGQSFAKVTVADVSGDKPQTLRELYYEGSYLSSRRYANGNQDVVRAILQAYPRYSGLFNPDVQAYDAWGRLYDQEIIDGQLDEWVARTQASIEATVLEDWLPLVREAKGGKLVNVDPACDAYYVPKAGLTEYGLTHVLSMDVNDMAGALGGITIMGAAQTVYSNTEHLVLAQPDYRWGPAVDFGLVDAQQTALHMFAIDGAKTTYEASGWVPGFVPSNNSQFAIDEKGGAIRIATTGWVRDNPTAKQNQPEFWANHPENHVFTTRADNNVLKIAGKTQALGHAGESITAARFVGDRGYVVTYRNTDPLIVVDVKDPEKLSVLGEIMIPGFSEYVHPIDDDHLVTVGQNGSSWGIQLQLFDVSNPAQIPAPKVLDFGQGSSSEASYNHKALTYFAPQNLLALPMYTNGYDQLTGQYRYSSTLQVIKVNTKTGFELLGEVDHAPLYTQQTCGGYCNPQGCYEYYCGYQPEVRRGHFVGNDSGTFVYSISYGGVLVNSLDDLTTPVATQALPAPEWNDGSSYGGGEGGAGSTGGGIGVTPPPGPPVAGGDAGAGSTGGGTSGGTPGDAQDGGASSDADAGVAMP